MQSTVLFQNIVSQSFLRALNIRERMSSFPSNYRDLTRFAEDGLEFSTTSNTAVKMYDALVNMVRSEMGSPLSFKYDKCDNVYRC